MRKFGLIGFPLSHSFSREYFLNKFRDEKIPDCDYINFPIESIAGLPGIISGNPDLLGLNVTIPYKELVIPFLNEIDASAEKIKAVNTIKISREGDDYLCKGFNTDIFGFTQALHEIAGTKHLKALILGSGGASKAVAFSLDQMGIQYHFISRKQTYLSYDEIGKDLLLEYKLIINTTPLGTFPEVDICPDIPYEYLTQDHILFDLVYNPSLTLFLLKGKEKGASISNGLRMLHLQAERSWEIWNS
jgi:shikimate dehydrogenase